MGQPPQGTVTFLFTDIVGSSHLWEKYPNHMRNALARHDVLLRGTVESHGGHVFKTVGDAFCVAFETPRAALESAVQAQRRLAAENWGEIRALAVRMGIHTGTAEYRDGDYFGGTLNRSARIEAAAHGGQILLSQASRELLSDERLDGVGFKSLGQHHLRNLDRPEHLFQATGSGLVEAFPPPRSLEVLPNNLPVQTTSFVGRERQIEEVKSLLAKTRLLTLTGMGGTGKTRLSIELGAQLIHDFRDGVWLVELAMVTGAERVVQAVATAVGVREESGRSLNETLVKFFQAKQMLLVLDNCEHIVAAVSPLVLDILHICPAITVLATSRQSFGILGEIAFPVPPLPVFDVRLEPLVGTNLAERLLQYEAVKLFVERATSVRPDFAVTDANARALAEICSRLDGIPLAIELAAARVRVLDLDQIAQRLDDRFRLLRGSNRSGGLAHQQTLQALIDWSHDLLSTPERVLFRRLGVFVGGRTLEALEAVCAGDGIDEFEVLDLIQQLVEKSLVVVEREAVIGSRFTLIESVWDYAREKLESSGEADSIRDRHLKYFVELAGLIAPHLEGPEQKEWLDRAHRESFNMRSASDWAIQSGKVEAACQIFIAMYRAIEVRGNLEEALIRVERLLQLNHDEVPPPLEADFYLAAGRLSWAADRYQEARKRLEKASELYGRISDEVGATYSNALQGFISRGEGNLDFAEQTFRRAKEVGRKLNIQKLESLGLSGLGSIALDRGDMVQARELKERALELFERQQDYWVIGLFLWGLVQVALAQKDYARVRSALAEWARIARDLGNRWALLYILSCYGYLAVDTNEPRLAARRFGAAEVLRRHFSSQFSPAEQSQYDAYVARLNGMLPAPELQQEWEAGAVASPWDLMG